MPDEAPEGKTRGARMRKREIERVRRGRRQRLALLGAGGAVVVVVILLATLYKPAVPITCQAHQVCDPYNPMHIHARLTFYSDSSPIPVPENIGIAGGPYAAHSLDDFLDLREGQKGNLAPVHTHDASGYIHVEARVTRAFTLGEFFDIWGKPLGPSRTWDFVADSGHKITLSLNGVLNADWGELVLQDNQQIEIRYVTL